MEARTPRTVFGGVPTFKGQREKEPLKEKEEWPEVGGESRESRAPGAVERDMS